MNDLPMVISVGELMLREKVITEFGLKILHNNIERDMDTLSPDDPQKITRTALYFTIVYNMAVLFAGYCAEKEIDDPKNIAANGSQNFFSHGDKAGVFGHPKAHFNKKEASA